MSEIAASYRVKTREDTHDVGVAQLEDEQIELTIIGPRGLIAASVELDADEITALLQCLFVASGRGDLDV